MWRYVLVAAFAALELSAQTTNLPSPARGQAVLLFAENRVEVLRHGAKTWDPADTNASYRILEPGDQLRTLANSRAGIQVPGYKETVILGELSYFQLPADSGEKSFFRLLKGKLFNFHRGPPGQMRFETPTISAINRGTEFLLQVDDNGGTEVIIFNGEVDMENNLGKLTLKTGEAGIARPGQAPVRTPVIVSLDLIQWCMYYPGVLCLDDLSPVGLGADLQASLQTYREGNLVQAIKAWPADRAPATDTERIYRAALLLSVGNIEGALPLLTNLSSSPAAKGNLVSPVRLGQALERLITVVKSPSAPGLAGTDTNHFSATEWLVESYALQSQHRLEASREAARNAVARAPDFGFGWERLAELEFGFGRVSEAQAALNRSLHLAPLNAEAVALDGFLLAAQNRIKPAITQFDRAIALDGSLGNAWLGRGLCRFRMGQVSRALDDIEVAAAVEPQRAIFRSYLGKAFSDTYADQRATAELKLAEALDPSDPTAWLYSALLKQKQDDINGAVSDLEKSIDQNDNREVYRSRLLLDEDRAVGSVNLASVYRDAGMTNVSVREAARAVTADYANDAAHLFLSDAYNDLRDPTQFNLRYETAWFNEYLLANILAPVGGGRLSQEVSQQQYSKLFQSDGLSLASSSDVRTDGMFHEQASQYGAVGNTAYAVDVDYRHNSGVRVNNDLKDLQMNVTLKQQVGPQDTALLLAQYQTIDSGDNFQYYNPWQQAQPYYRYDENQEPILVGAWHHEWGPGMHTLALVGRLTDEQHFTDRAAPQLLLGEDPHGAVNGASSDGFDIDYHNSFVIYSAEVNQICEWDHVTLSVGSRYQNGSFQAQDQYSNPTTLGHSILFPNNLATADSITAAFDRLTGYGYATVRPMGSVWLTGGVACDEVKYPDNYRQAPISPGEETRSQIGPKAGLVWDVKTNVTLRGCYTRSLGGVSLDESYRLEPTQVAGFPQAFRSLISESIVGSVAAPTYETEGLALDLKFGSRTYAGIELDRLLTDVHRADGVFALVNGNAPFTPITTPEQLNYQERDLSVNLDRLLGQGFAVGANYKLILADLHDVLPDVPVSALASADQRDHAFLNEAGVHVLFNHSSGFFAKLEMAWYKQQNWGYSPALPGDDFFQENLYAGYRFAHRRGELMLGLLNFGGGDYHLNPLTPYEELPRKRVFEARLNFLF